MLDLGELVFMDSRGFRVLFEIKSLCEEVGCAFCVVPGPETQRLFEIFGVQDQLSYRGRGAALHRPGDRAETQ